MQSVCERYTYLLDPSKDIILEISKDDAIIMKYDIMMLQYAKEDAIMVQTHISVTEGRGKKVAKSVPTNSRSPDFFFMCHVQIQLPSGQK